MASAPQVVALAWLAASIALEIVGTTLLKRADGFRHRGPGALGLACVLASFATLSQAIRGMDLSVAYALWGGVGILVTSTLGWLLFRQRIRPVGWCGVLLIVAGAAALNFA
jgi:spermidine export protein MdtI